MASQLPKQPAEPRLHRWLNVSLILFTGLLLLCLFDFYALPNNDLLNFALPAQSFSRLEIPDEIKVAPVYPILISLASGMAQTLAELLQGAQRVSLLSGLVLLVVLWSLGRNHLPTWNPLFLLLVAFSPCFLGLSLQPLVEVLLVALVALTFLAVTKQKTGTACFAASATALARMDAGQLIPLVMGVRFFTARGWIARTLPCLLAGLAPAAWLAMQMIRTRYGSPYVEEFLTSTNFPGYVYLAPMLARMLLGLPPSGDPLSLLELVLALGLVGLALIGVFKLYRQNRATALVMLGFLVGYAAIHAAFKAANYRYNWPLLLWLVFLILKAFEPRNPGHPSRPASLGFKVLFLGLGVVALLAGGTLFQAIHVRWAWAVAAIFTALFFGNRAISSRKALGAAAGFSLILLLVGSNLRVWEASYYADKTRFVEHLEAGRWMETHAAPGEKALMVEPWLIEPRMPGVSSTWFISTERFPATEPYSYLEQVETAGLEYVIWLSYYGDWGAHEFWQRRSRAYILNALGLGEPRSRPGFEYIETVSPHPGHWANIFRLRSDQARMPGRVMDPAEEVSFRLLLGKGWRAITEGPPKERFIWSTALRSDLVLGCPNPSDGATLRFSASPYSGPGARPQTVQVLLEGEPLEEVVLAKGRHTYSIAVPAHRMRKGSNRFEFSFAYAGNPGTGPLAQGEDGFTAQFFRIELSAGVEADPAQDRPGEASGRPPSPAR